MLIEALIPMNLTLPEGVKTLKPGEQVNLPEDKARKLLDLAKEKVRVSRTQWTESWCELAKMTENIEEGSPKFQPLLKALEGCDVAFAQENWGEFFKAYQAVKALVEGKSHPMHPEG